MKYRKEDSGNMVVEEQYPEKVEQLIEMLYMNKKRGEGNNNSGELQQKIRELM